MLLRAANYERDRNPSRQDEHPVHTLQRAVGNRMSTQFMKKTIQRTKMKDKDFVGVPFGYGIAGSLDKHNLYSTDYNSCNAVEMLNMKTRDGGLYHVLGGGAHEAEDYLRQMFMQVMPTHIKMYNGRATDGPVSEYLDSWAVDHFDMEKMFRKFEKEMKYSELGIKLNIEVNEKDQVGNIAVGLDDQERATKVNTGEVGIGSKHPDSPVIGHGIMDSGDRDALTKKGIDVFGPKNKEEAESSKSKDDGINRIAIKLAIRSILGTPDEHREDAYYDYTDDLSEDEVKYVDYALASYNKLEIKQINE